MTDGATGPAKQSDLKGRLVALAIAIAALALMIWIGRNDVSSIQYALSLVGGPQPVEQTGSGNPELDACLAQRVGDVEKMKADGVINAAQFESFKSRAITLCEAQHLASQ